MTILAGVTASGHGLDRGLSDSEIGKLNRSWGRALNRLSRLMGEGCTWSPDERRAAAAYLCLLVKGKELPDGMILTPRVMRRVETVYKQSIGERVRTVPTRKHGRHRRRRGRR